MNTEIQSILNQSRIQSESVDSHDLKFGNHGYSEPPESNLANLELDNDGAVEEVPCSPRIEHDDEMDMTALIDITFLLLIFFVVTSKISSEVKQPLPMARNGQSVANNNAIILSVRAGGGDSAIVSRLDGVVFSDDPEQQAAEIGEYLQLGFSQNKTELLIRADGAVRSGEIQRIKEIVSDSLEEGQLISFGVHHESK